MDVKDLEPVLAKVKWQAAGSGQIKGNADGWFFTVGRFAITNKKSFTYGYDGAACSGAIVVRLLPHQAKAAYLAFEEKEDR